MQVDDVHDVNTNVEKNPVKNTTAKTTATTSTSSSPSNWLRTSSKKRRFLQHENQFISHTPHTPPAKKGQHRSPFKRKQTHLLPTLLEEDKKQMTTTPENPLVSPPLLVRTGNPQRKKSPHKRKSPKKPLRRLSGAFLRSHRKESTTPIVNNSRKTTENVSATDACNNIYAPKGISMEKLLITSAENDKENQQKSVNREFSSKKRLFSTSMTDHNGKSTNSVSEVKKQKNNILFNEEGEEKTPSPLGFTSSSQVKDIGLFNCEFDVEYTGSVYGEGTDGKVEACVVRGQKIALKKAKPHENFTKNSAKRRSAIELHYLRRVRHNPNFIQCVGMCDGIDHMCIALEVMDCKLSEFQRKLSKKKSKASTTKEPLPLKLTMLILRKVCQAMIFLHEKIKVAHGDLACRNILIRKVPKSLDSRIDPEIRLADFGRVKTMADENPCILADGFSFYQNCDVGSFGREVLYRIVTGETIPPHYLESRSLHQHLEEMVLKENILTPEIKSKLGDFYPLFCRCIAWGVRPTFREISEHLADLEFFAHEENGFFPLKPNLNLSTHVSPHPQSQRELSFLSPIPVAQASPIESTGSNAIGSSTKLQPSSNSSHISYSIQQRQKLKANKKNRSDDGASANGSSSIKDISATMVKKTASINSGGSNSSAAPPTAVNWLKPRSILTPQQHQRQMHIKNSSSSTNNNSKVSVTPKTAVNESGINRAGINAGNKDAKFLTPRFQRQSSHGTSKYSIKILKEITKMRNLKN